ncbi:MAG TPA: multidrug transporter [Acetivibrio sp.]|jgi:Na+-driven multidrug efflux pump|uniref:MATE family Na+-driven efflux transporter n=1 Tax=Acetivibrio sp. TaxID=1872092 RepID=UPI002BF07865|nr:MATE family Na+-driven efflux transporter [Acetivibrio sp.]HOM03591.1 multidrug transporter [Acetivibrio sp.]
MQKIKESIKSINYKLFLALLLMGLLPTVYTTVRIFYLGQLPGDWGYNIASQLSWVNLLYEIIQEAIILPLFFFIGKAFKKNIDELNNTVRTGAIATFGVYSLLSIIIIIFAVPMIKLMAQDTTLIAETATYIRLETVANIFATLVKFFVIVLVTVKKEKYLYFILSIQMILSIILDTFFVSSLNVSLRLGVNGIAYTNMIINALLLMLAVYFLYREKIVLLKKAKLNFQWMKEWLKVGGYSGLESFVRNIAFMLMIVRMVNVVGEQGTFWVTNNFIWGWLLLPILQLGELIKRDCGEEGIKAVKSKSYAYFLITAVICVLWLVTIPAWEPFIKNVMNVSNAHEVYILALISLGFYILFAFNNVIDSIFYGLGKTNYMLFQSLVINIVYYGLMFILYATGVYEPTLTKIALMFAGGTAMDSVLTYFIFWWMLKKKKGGMEDNLKAENV